MPQADIFHCFRYASAATRYADYAMPFDAAAMRQRYLMPP